MILRSWRHRVSRSALLVARGGTWKSQNVTEQGLNITSRLIFSHTIKQRGYRPPNSSLNRHKHDTFLHKHVKDMTFHEQI